MSFPALAAPFGAANIEGLRRRWFGDGSDGDVTVSGAVTLTRDMHYRNLTVIGTNIINTAGFRIFVSNTLDLTQAGGAAIYRSGSSGGAGSGGSGGAGAGSAGSQTVGGRHAGGAGGSGTSGAGGNGATLPASTQYVFGGLASVGGAGGAGSGGAGGVGGTPPAVVPYDIRYPTLQLRRGPELVVGGVSNAGGGAGGGDGTAGGGGGGGAGAGAIVFIAARRILRGPGTAVGAIYLRGGLGGAGASAGGGNRGGGGGGAGAAGGLAYILYEQLLGSPAVDAIDVGGGSGGPGGNGTGTGLGGQGGQGGYAGRATLINVLTGEVRSSTNASVPPSVSVPVTSTGSAGGSRIIHLATL